MGGTVLLSLPASRERQDTILFGLGVLFWGMQNVSFTLNFKIIKIYFV